MAIVWNFNAIVYERDKAVAEVVLGEGVELEFEARFFVLILYAKACTFENRDWAIEHYP